MGNRIEEIFSKNQKVVSLYFTAGFPKLDDTLLIAQHAEKYGATMLEIGIPFSDPVADGPVIQSANEQALQNGMSINLLFSQLKKLRDHCSLPVILMGYWNPILQFGVDKFVAECGLCKVDGVIVPDLPAEEFMELLKPTLDKAGIHGILLITPVTPDERIEFIDSISSGFIYAVSSPAITGKNLVIDENAQRYFERIKQLKLKNPIMVGFGISNRESFEKVTQYADGGIIGSAFIKALKDSMNDLEHTVKEFISGII